MHFHCQCDVRVGLHVGQYYKGGHLGFFEEKNLLYFIVQDQPVHAMAPKN